MSSISAGTTSTTALVSTADTTGALVLKTGASATTALTLDTSQNATFVGSIISSNVTAPIQPITASVAANALTITLNPTSLNFRSSTLGSGTVNTRTVSAAISVVVPSSATLGTVNATASRLVVIAIDNSGTVELAVVNIAGGNQLDETNLISTTTISAAATANNVIYSTTGRSNVPYRVVGFIDSTQTTAGTWATAPSTIQGVGGQALAALSSLGYGQTWTSVTRAASTTYYNTTGKPIVLALYGVSSASGNMNIVPTINGAALNSIAGSFANAASNTGIQGNIVIPANASYSFTLGNCTISNAWELR